MRESFVIFLKTRDREGKFMWISHAVPVEALKKWLSQPKSLSKMTLFRVVVSALYFFLPPRIQ